MADVTPFEWLTSASSLRPLLHSAFSKLDDISVTNHGDAGALADSNVVRRQVLHVGCGSSVIGEVIVEETSYDVATVINVDCDPEVLHRMQERWTKRCQTTARMECNESQHSDTTRQAVNDDAMLFVVADFTVANALAELGTETIDLVVDKSTLDCMLCTGTGVAGLLVEVYRLLRPGGIYLVISFHPVDFLGPLLENLPGADWSVIMSTMTRQVEDLTNNKQHHSRTTEPLCELPTKVGRIGDEESPPSAATRTWSSGTFQSDRNYQTTVNVFQCQKYARHGHEENLVSLDWKAVNKHVHETNNEWYIRENPLLTPARIASIHEAFGHETKDLRTSYELLFTLAEQEHFDYEDFVEDWQVFLSNHSSIPKIDSVSAGTAIAFLNAMQ